GQAGGLACPLRRARARRGTRQRTPGSPLRGPDPARPRGAAARPRDDAPGHDRGWRRAPLRRGRAHRASRGAARPLRCRGRARPAARGAGIAVAEATSPAPGTHEGLLARLSQVPFKGERTVWLLGHGREDFEAAADLIEALTARYPRLDFLLTAPQQATRAWLRARFPRAVVLPPPLPLGFIAARTVVNFNVRG